MYLTKYFTVFVVISITVPLVFCQEAIVKDAFNKALQGLPSKLIVGRVAYIWNSLSLCNTPIITVVSATNYYHIFITRFCLRIRGRWTTTSSQSGNFLARANSADMRLRYRKSTKKIDVCNIGFSTITVDLSACTACDKTSFLDKLTKDLRTKLCFRLKQRINGKL